MAVIDDVKLSLRIMTDDFDSEIQNLIDACLQDLNIAGVIVPEEESPIVLRAITTYVKANFGEPDEYDRLKQSYDEQKAQLSMFTGFTDWGK